MKETRELWDEWSDDFQAAWNADTDEDELPPAPIHYGPGFPEDKRLDVLPAIAGADVVELGCGGGQASVGFARKGPAVLLASISPRSNWHTRRNSVTPMTSRDNFWLAT